MRRAAQGRMADPGSREARRGRLPRWRSTTIVCVRHLGRVAIAGDGQVSFGDQVMKHTARKVRRMHNDRVVAGFAGAAADAFALFAKFEVKLEEFGGNLPRAAVELAKDWRMDRALRRLEALLAVADADHSLIISGTGDVIEPDDGIIGIGSGGGYAAAAARALVKHSTLSAREIAEEAMRIAAALCVYTNDRVTIEEL
jgi:ATP-dependent HslUV protease, peptidase subunit HslV